MLFYYELNYGEELYQHYDECIVPHLAYYNNNTMYISDRMYSYMRDNNMQEMYL